MAGQPKVFQEEVLQMLFVLTFFFGIIPSIALLLPALLILAILITFQRLMETIVKLVQQLERGFFLSRILGNHVP